MKKTISLCLSLLLLFAFSACKRSEYIDLSAFVALYNETQTEENQISLTDFFVLSRNSNETVYSCFLSCGNFEYVLKVCSESDGCISRCSVLCVKCDENGSKKAFGGFSSNEFKQVCENVVKAFSFENKGISNEIINTLFQKGSDEEFLSERKLSRGIYNYTALSNDFCDKFTVSNKWLYDIGQTQKPESKNDFPENTSIRTETVPHN